MSTVSNPPPSQQRTQQTQQTQRPQPTQQPSQQVEQQRSTQTTSTAAQVEQQRDRFQNTSAPASGLDKHAPTASPTTASVEAQRSATQVRRGITDPAAPTTETGAPAASTPEKPQISAENQRRIETLGDPNANRSDRASAAMQLSNEVYRRTPGVAQAIGDHIAANPESAGTGSMSLKGVLETRARQGVPEAQAALKSAEVGAHLTSFRESHGAQQEAAAQALQQDLASSDPDVRARATSGLGEIARSDHYRASEAAKALGQAGTPESLDELAKSTEGTRGYTAAEELKKAGQAGLDAAMRQWPNLSTEQRESLRGVLSTSDAERALQGGDPGVTQAVGDLAMQGATGGTEMDRLKRAGTPAAADQLARLTGHSSSSTAYLAGAALRDMGQTGADAANRAWAGASDAQKVNLLDPISTEAGLGTEQGRAAVLEAAGSSDPALAKAGLEAADLATRTGRIDAAGPEVAKQFRGEALDVAAKQAATSTNPDVRKQALAATDSLADGGLPASRLDPAAAQATLQDAASDPAATTEGKAGLDAQASQLARQLSASPNIAAMQEAVVSGTPEQKAAALSQASFQDQKLLEARLQREGTSISGVLDEVRQGASPASFDKAIDQVASRGNPDEAAKALKLAADAGDAAALERFADRSAQDGSTVGTWRGSEVLAKANDPAAVAALAKAPLDASERATAARALGEHTSPENVEKGASAVMRDAGASAEARESAATLATKAGTPAAKEEAAQFRRAEAQQKIDAAQEVMDDTEGRLREAQEKLPELKAVAAGLKEEGVAVPAALQNTIARMESNVVELSAEREAAAKEVTDYLAQPEVRESLGNLNADQASRLAEDAARSVAGTQAGMKFGHDVVAKELGKGEVTDPFFKKAFGVAERASGNAGLAATFADRSLNIVNGFAAGLAASGERNYLQAMGHALGMDANKVSDFANMAADARANPSGQFARQLGRLGNVVGKASASLDLMNAAFSTVKAARNPTDARAWADAANNIATAARNFTKLGSKAFVGATAVMAPITAITGSLDTIDAIGRNDWHATAGNGAVALGGGLATAGVIMSATGVGAAAGVPLMVAGGVISAGGALYAAVFGDGWAESRAKELGYLIGDG